VSGKTANTELLKLYQTMFWVDCCWKSCFVMIR